MRHEAVVSPVEAREVCRVFRTFVSGVAVVTCRSDDGVAHGATVNSFTAVSLDPPLVQATLTRSSWAVHYLKGAPFALNVLSIEQLDVALHFAGSTEIKKTAWALEGNVPVLLNNAATLACRPWNIYDGGDHLIVVGEVIFQKSTKREPLLFFGGNFCQIGSLVDGALLDHPTDASDIGWFAGAASFKPMMTPT